MWGVSAHLLIENVTQDFKNIIRADLYEQLINESKHQRANQKADSKRWIKRRSMDNFQSQEY
jgi:hypothetical protein